MSLILFVSCDQAQTNNFGQIKKEVEKKKLKRTKRGLADNWLSNLSAGFKSQVLQAAFAILSGTYYKSSSQPELIEEGAVGGESIQEENQINDIEDLEESLFNLRVIEINAAISDLEWSPSIFYRFDLSRAMAEKRINDLKEVIEKSKNLSASLKEKVEKELEELQARKEEAIRKNRQNQVLITLESSYENLIPKIVESIRRIRAAREQIKIIEGQIGVVNAILNSSSQIEDLELIKSLKIELEDLKKQMDGSLSVARRSLNLGENSYLDKEQETIENAKEIKEQAKNQANKAIKKATQKEKIILRLRELKISLDSYKATYLQSLNIFFEKVISNQFIDYFGNQNYELDSNKIEILKNLLLKSIELEEEVQAKNLKIDQVNELRREIISLLEEVQEKVLQIELRLAMKEQARAGAQAALKKVRGQESRAHIALAIQSVFVSLESIIRARYQLGKLIKIDFAQNRLELAKKRDLSLQRIYELYSDISAHAKRIKELESSQTLPLEAELLKSSSENLAREAELELRKAILKS